MTADDRYDVVVVGAGIVGLAVALELQRRRPGTRVAVVEKEDAPGRHQSGHNSGVVHAGLYYPPGSLKARLCRDGRRALEDYAAVHGIPLRRCGKLVVALDDTEIPRLLALAERARANGLTDVVELAPGEWTDIEPNIVGRRALWVPQTGVVDFAAVTRALADDVTSAGGRLLTGWEVTAAERRPGGWALRSPAGELHASYLVGCAGLHSDRLARATGVEPPVRIVPFRGDYYTLRPDAAHLVRGLVYPVPDPALPFLGVHFTRRVDGTVWAGPNAVPAGSREGYRRRDVRRRDMAELVRYAGTRRLARRLWRYGAAELWRDTVKPAFVASLRRYLPALRSRDLTFGPSGVRAQAVDASGSLVDDFRLLPGADALHVVNAPSPAATSALAIAAHVVDLIEARR